MHSPGICWNRAKHLTLYVNRDTDSKEALLNYNSEVLQLQVQDRVDFDKSAQYITDSPQLFNIETAI
jgi:hypothetical protein